MTTFGGRALAKRHPEAWKQRQHLVYGPGEHHPLAHNLLYAKLVLQSGMQVKKGGCITMSNIYEVDWRRLTAFYGDSIRETRQFVFDEESMQRVLGVARAEGGGYRPGQQYSPGLFERFRAHGGRLAESLTASCVDVSWIFLFSVLAMGLSIFYLAWNQLTARAATPV